MEFGLVLLISSVLAGGVIGALVRTWSIHARLYSLEDRVNVVEGIVTREVKTRAATERWKKPSKDEELLLNAMNAPVRDNRPWWVKAAESMPREAKS